MSGNVTSNASFVLPHQDAAWRIIKERLDALEDACASLGKQPGLSALDPLATKLQSMSHDIGKHSARTAVPEPTWRSDGCQRGQ